MLCRGPSEPRSELASEVTRVFKTHAIHGLFDANRGIREKPCSLAESWIGEQPHRGSSRGDLAEQLPQTVIGHPYQCCQVWNAPASGEVTLKLRLHESHRRPRVSPPQSAHPNPPQFIRQTGKPVQSHLVGMANLQPKSRLRGMAPWAGRRGCLTELRTVGSPIISPWHLQEPARSG
jgi:hypothetical protein